jgi:hypothetical protein
VTDRTRLALCWHFPMGQGVPGIFRRKGVLPGVAALTDK